MKLGGGWVVPYPEPGSAAATRMGKANRRAGSKPEEGLRRELHRLGLRFRKDHLIRAGSIRTHADVAFTRVRLAVFVDGCFWHQCPEHFHMPKTNLGYWVPKLTANVERDLRIDEALGDDLWALLRLWEHVGCHEAAIEVVGALAALGHPRARAIVDGSAVGVTRGT